QLAIMIGQRSLLFFKMLRVPVMASLQVFFIAQSYMQRFQLTTSRGFGGSDRGLPKGHAQGLDVQAQSVLQRAQSLAQCGLLLARALHTLSGRAGLELLI